MASQLPNLTPTQVVALQDELLTNADRLLSAAKAVLGLGHVDLARSLAILGVEESGKAIALHERRVAIVYAPEGEPFVTGELRSLWGSHTKKLKAAYDFLVDESYWFGREPADPDENQARLGTIDDWVKSHNGLKQRGFYVDVDDQGDAVAPSDTDPESLADVIDQVHQIGWQLRLGEHIEAKRQEEESLGAPPASDDEIDRFRAILDGDAARIEPLLQSMREGHPGRALHNDAYRLHLGAEPFENAGRRGYEAQDRELWRLHDRLGQHDL